MKRQIKLVAAMVLALVIPDKVRADPFSLEQALSAPFPSGLMAAPAGGKVAWVFNERGTRNIWIAEPPAYQGRRLTSYASQDGLDVYGLAWSPDGRTLAYVRGGDEEMGGEYPNPRSRVKKPVQEVWLIRTEGGAPRLVGEGHSPRISPRHSRLVFLKKGQVWWTPLDGKAKPEQLLEVRGTCESLRWSPDGERLAFASERKDHNFIGIYDWPAKAVRWLDPSVDLDLSPVWSPDGRQVAFVRIPSARRFATETFVPARSAEPWSIRVADAASGQGRLVWKADRGTGSAFRGIVGTDQLFWASGDRIVFPWERDAWTHLYSVAVSGGSPTLLTAGQFEVEDVFLSPDRSKILFNSNQNDIDRRHIWQVAPAGGPSTQLTLGQGIEWAPTLTNDGGTLVYLHSDAHQPARPAIRVGNDERDLAPSSRPADFPADQLLEPQQVMLSAADGMMIHGQLFLPPDAANGKRHPAIVFFHGGSRRQMLLGWHYMYYYHNAYALNQCLASRGYVVLSVNYRSGIGYGMEFREALRYGAGGASEFNDVLGAGLYLRSRADVDPKRIGLWGGSYGGYLTALGLARASDLFAAGVDIHGVYDWNAEINNFLPDYRPRDRQEFARVAYESSPIDHVKSWRSPVLLIHGDDDRNVPFSETVHLAEDLRKQKVEVEQLIFPDEVHDFLTHARWLQAYQAAVAFFDRRLGDKQP
jgi:dipeptidyl aminopeptidase/acylaminoacyl peptidase